MTHEDEIADVRRKLEKALDAIFWEMEGCVGERPFLSGFGVEDEGTVECADCRERENCHLYQTYRELTT